MKRRTRQEKEHPYHQFAITWRPAVKGHFKNKPDSQFHHAYEAKKADRLAKEGSFEAIRHDIVKTLIFASLILACEVVIYLKLV